MKDRLKVYCVNTGYYVDIKGGETLLEIYNKVREEIGDGFRPICAHVNNKTEGLDYAVYSPKMVEYLDERSPSGERVMVRSLCMMLYKAVTDVLPDVRLRIEHSISRGYYCRLLDRESSKGIEVNRDMVIALESRMHELVAEDLEFIRKERLSRDVKEKFREQGLLNKVLLLDTTRQLYTVYYSLGGIRDSFYGPLAPSTGYLEVFRLLPYKEGFLLMGRDKNDLSRTPEPLRQEKMYKAFTDNLRFNEIIGVSNVGELNMAAQKHHTADVINVAEALHEKMLGQIASEICERRKSGGARVVLISGPSSSGKTTSTKRLGIQLMTHLVIPKMISLDDYFVDREQTPRDSTGDYDYESLYALDLDRLNSDLKRLLAGEEINLPTYSFELGRRVEKQRPLKLEKNEVLLIEGIHGLNPELTGGLPASELFKVYVSALTTLSIDDHNWISTTDTRLVRRIVRDNKYRNTSAEETIRRWPSVRRGEERWIFPYQENADAMFNSSLIYELGVMREYAEPLLREVGHDRPEFAQAYRLMRLLSYFDNIALRQIPSTSLLREFLGGSSFKY
ncbi:MAG: nucleoside kinase [Prevotella sp.]|nr:nucleoside kinase [Bacteroides sp.]MCM1366932.1 nucleoside kinase [Prevotella sp.]MCM1437463.1 nucleoside kinase [Prevotella sp.]